MVWLKKTGGRGQVLLLQWRPTRAALKIRSEVLTWSHQNYYMTLEIQIQVLVSVQEEKIKLTHTHIFITTL